MPNIKNLMNSNSDVQRKRRYMQMRMEESAAERLRKDGWTVFSPTVVCDRIAVYGKRVYFVEFKKPGQRLTPSQEKIRSLAINYKVVHY